MSRGSTLTHWMELRFIWIIAKGICIWVIVYTFEKKNILFMLLHLFFILCMRNLRKKAVKINFQIKSIWKIFIKSGQKERFSMFLQNITINITLSYIGLSLWNRLWIPLVTCELQAIKNHNCWKLSNFNLLGIRKEMR